MGIKSLLKKTDKKDLQSKIYLKELKPEMTQCRIVQVDNKIKEKIKWLSMRVLAIIKIFH